MLEMRDVDCFYGAAQVLRGFSLTAEKGEILCLLGRNGAGKTTALKAIMGLVPPRGGAIMLDGTVLSALPAHEVPRHGVGYVPQDSSDVFREAVYARTAEPDLTDPAVQFQGGAFVKMGPASAA